jgi:hypothetical protein
MNVIGLTGYAGSGKSTVANYLVEEHGFTRLSFAAPLKKMLRTLDPILGLPPIFWSKSMGDFRLSDLWKLAEQTEQFSEGEIKAEVWIKNGPWGDEYRRLLQVLGTDCIRAVDPEFWVKAAVAQMTNPEGKYVFDDVRFPNEAKVIEGYGWLNLWNVRRPGFEAVNGHDSEKWAGNMGEKFILNNGSDREGLHDQIDFGLSMTTFDPEAATA